MTFESIVDLADVRSETSVIKEIHQKLKEIKDVEGFHKVRSRKVGPHRFVDLHIEVAPHLSITSAHQVGEEVKDHLLKISALSDVIVHIDPSNKIQRKLQEPLKNIENQIREILERQDWIKGTERVILDFDTNQISANIVVEVDRKTDSLEEVQYMSLVLKEKLLKEMSSKIDDAVISIK